MIGTFCMTPSFISNAAVPYRFNRINGGKISSTPSDPVVLNVIVFGRPGSFNTQNTLSI